MRVLVANNAKSEAIWQEIPDIKASDGQVRIAVEAAGLNRADLLQIKGKYPGKIDGMGLGLECSGVVDQVGRGVDKAWCGRKVCALLRAGGLADYVVCSPSVLVSVPNGIELSLAAGLCETWCTALFNLWDQARVRPRERVLIHAGGSGVGAAAIQLTRLLGAIPYVTCGTEDKLDYCLRLGAEAGVLRTTDWVAHYQGLGLQFDVVLDPVGGAYLDKNLSVAGDSARIALIGLLGGLTAEANLLEFLTKNVTLFGRTLRTQSDHVKRRLLAELETIVWPALQRGRVHHAVEQIFTTDEVSIAYARMQDSDQMGKSIVVLK
ncbi:zinc-binding dehydrogenase [Litorivicinus sp.]|jgi:NADPH:quinone reductase-like Zn-dependent oxidoreductase|nr:zinc-binding dehydrogenase [Litorivicinus sp.]